MAPFYTVGEHLGSRMYDECSQLCILSVIGFIFITRTLTLKSDGRSSRNGCGARLSGGSVHVELVAAELGARHISDLEKRGKHMSVKLDEITHRGIGVVVLGFTDVLPVRSGSS